MTWGRVDNGWLEEPLGFGFLVVFFGSQVFQSLLNMIRWNTVAPINLFGGLQITEGNTILVKLAWFCFVESNQVSFLEENVCYPRCIPTISFNGCLSIAKIKTGVGPPELSPKMPKAEVREILVSRKTEGGKLAAAGLRGVWQL